MESPCTWKKAKLSLATRAIGSIVTIGDTHAADPRARTRANAVLVRALKELFKLVFAAHLFACFMSYVSMEQHMAIDHGTDDAPGDGCDPAQCWWFDKWDDGHARQVSGITLSKKDMAARSVRRTRRARARFRSSSHSHGRARTDTSRASTGLSRR